MALVRRKKTVANNQELHHLIKRIREGDSKSADKLLSMFSPLIWRTCRTLFNRYNSLISMDDLLADGKRLLIYLAGVEYEIGGRAFFPNFAKSYLHARLVQLCRPTLAYRKRANELTDQVPDKKSPYKEIFQQERDEVITAINDFMWKVFSDRELDIIVNHVIRGESRDALAERYHVSKMRMKHIHKRCMGKLRIFLKKFNITGMKDI